MRPIVRTQVAFCLVLLGIPAAARAAPAMRLEVDAREAPRRLVHARMEIPAAPGPLTLYYPKWVPGTHAPSGPLSRVVNLRFAAAGKPLSWHRDAVEFYAFHCDVPPGAGQVEVTLDYLLPASRDSLEVSVGVVATPQLAILNWNALLLYPGGRPAGDIPCAASLRLPPGWKYASVLPVAAESASGVQFQEAPLPRLIDSPVLAGAYMRTLPLAPSLQLPHQLEIAADSPASLQVSSEFEQRLQQMVLEADALFGAHHYGRFRFLVALSGDIPSFGLEHHECSVNSGPEGGLNDRSQQRGWLGYLLAHEYMHSWNGKYRRPAGMATASFHEPLRTDLVWVYEGLSQYLSDLLLVRSGLRPPQTFYDELATNAADLAYRPGRTWRSLADAAVAYPFADRGGGWPSWRRNGNDVYYEGELVWLEVDARIRQLSQGKRSLDDFCLRFFGGQNGPPVVVPYTLEDILLALGEIASYDWRGLLNARLNSTQPAAPLDGLELSGWRLVYGDAPPGQAPSTDFRTSLGLRLGGDGAIFDVIAGSPADRVRLLPGLKVVGVND